MNFRISPVSIPDILRFSSINLEYTMKLMKIFSNLERKKATTPGNELGFKVAFSENACFRNLRRDFEPILDECCYKIMNIAIDN